MTCPQCGSGVASSAKFCPECGAALQDTAAEEHYHLHAIASYWSGDYSRTFEFSKLSAEMGAVAPHGGEALLRGAGQQGLALDSPHVEALFALAP